MPSGSSSTSARAASGGSGAATFSKRSAITGGSTTDPRFYVLTPDWIGRKSPSSRTYADVTVMLAACDRSLSTRAASSTLTP